MALGKPFRCPAQLSWLLNGGCYFVKYVNNCQAQKDETISKKLSAKSNSIPALNF